jgi:hypothetical protein
VNRYLSFFFGDISISQNSIDGKEKEKDSLLPIWTDQDIAFTEKRFFAIFFVEIKIKVKQGQKQLISLNEQRSFARRIGNTFY